MDYTRLVYELPYSLPTLVEVLTWLNQVHEGEVLSGINAFIDNRPDSRRVYLGLVFRGGDLLDISVTETVLKDKGGKKVEIEMPELVQMAMEGGFNFVLGDAQPELVGRLFIDMSKAN